MEEKLKLYLRTLVRNEGSDLHNKIRLPGTGTYSRCDENPWKKYADTGYGRKDGP